MYHFKCFKCNAELEKYFGFHDEHKVECECGNSMSKVILPTPAIFNGTGWGGQK